MNANTTLVFICGSALRGQPDHENLAAARFVGEARTQTCYRLHSVKNGWHPGIYEVAAGGISIPGELYELSQDQYEHLLAHEPPDMYPAPVRLEGGGEAIAILYPRELIERDREPDISHYGSWTAYKASLKDSPQG